MVCDARPPRRVVLASIYYIAEELGIQKAVSCLPLGEALGHWQNERKEEQNIIDNNWESVQLEIELNNEEMTQEEDFV